MAASSGLKEKRESDASTLSFGPELKNTHPLLTSETLLLLQNYSTQREQHAQTTGFPFPGLPAATTKALEHSTQFSKYSNREIIREIRQSMLNPSTGDQAERMKNARGMVEFEMVQVANLLPETVDEAKALVPSLAGSVDEDDLQKILDDLSTIRRFQS
jgi:DNA-directed RNA polymerase II subunit RPB4